MPRDYAKLTHRFWHGSTGRTLARGGGDHPPGGYPDAQRLAAYLIAGSREQNLTGIYYCPIPMMAFEAGLHMDTAEEPTEQQGLSGLQQGVHAALATLIDLGFCRYDHDTAHVWVVQAARYQVAEELNGDDNRLLAIRRTLETIERDAPELVAAFREHYGAIYELAKHPEAPRKGGERPPEQPPPKGSGKGHGNPPGKGGDKPPPKGSGKGHGKPPGKGGDKPPPKGHGKPPGKGGGKPTRATRTTRTTRAAAAAEARESARGAPPAPAAAAERKGARSSVGANMPLADAAQIELDDAESCESHPVRMVFGRYAEIVTGAGLSPPNHRYVGQLIARAVVYWRGEGRDPAEELLQILDYCVGSDWARRDEKHVGWPPEHIFGAMRYPPDRLQQRLARSAELWRKQAGSTCDAPLIADQGQPGEAPPLSWDQCPSDPSEARCWLDVELTMAATELARRAGDERWQTYRAPARDMLREILGPPPKRLEGVLT